MISEQVETYIKELIPSRSPRVEEMEIYAQQHGVPIMDLVGMDTLLQLLKVNKPEKILEIGAAIGYSAIRMGEAMPNASIVTIERDEERYEQAKRNIQEFDLSSRITLLFGDAAELAEAVEEHGPYDAIFIDAAKGQYQKFFDLYGSMARKGGLIITDNVLFRGHVANDEELNSRRLRSLVKKIRAFNEYVMAHEDYDSSLLPVGDGMLLSIKK